MATKVFELLVSDLPRGFLKALIERVPLVYAEAHDSVTHDPRFGEAEARYLHGHTRRAILEATLRTTAQSFGMAVEMRRAEGVGGPEHVMVISGRFCFTACHLPSSNGFPKESRHRQQYSMINEHVTQGQLFPISSEPDAADIYGVIAHCEVPGEKGTLGTLVIGFPNDSCDDWIDEPIDVVDLADAQERLKSSKNRESTAAAAPKWKKRKDEKGDAG